MGRPFAADLDARRSGWIPSSLIALLRRSMIRVVRPIVHKLLVTALLTRCIGVQVLEASGRWDRALQDTNDEAVIVVVVLCIGAAFAGAGALLTRIRPSRISSRIVLVPTRPSAWPATRFDLSTSYTSPPVSLRI